MALLGHFEFQRLSVYILDPDGNTIELKGPVDQRRGDIEASRRTLLHIRNVFLSLLGWWLGRLRDLITKDYFV